MWSNPNDPDTDLDPSEWAPSNLQAQVLNDSQIKLIWSQEEENIKGFRLERKQNTGTNWTLITELGKDTTEYTDSGLTLGTDYTYRVKAFTDVNESGYVTSNTTNTSFPPPTNLTATPIDDQSIQLIWTDNCSFENGYRLERSDGGSFAQIAELDVAITEYTDSGLTLGTDYTYRVKAFTDVNESGYAETTMPFYADCAGDIGGTAVEDCNGDCNGTAFENECGCVGGNTGLETDFCYGCTDSNYDNYDSQATIDDGTCMYICTDIDGNVYQTVEIGDQVWMAENLKVTHYRNGDAIPTGHSNSEWSNLYDTETGAYCVYDDNEANADTYGYLYNWYAVDDSRNIAPEGWHVPTDDEIKALEMYLGMSQSEADDTGYRGTNEGSKLAGNADLWNSGALENNSEFGSSGFTALPGGYRFSSGNYYYMGFFGYFWSSAEYDSYDAWTRGLIYDISDVYRYNGSKQYGFSVRCIRD